MSRIRIQRPKVKDLQTLAYEKGHKDGIAVLGDAEMYQTAYGVGYAAGLKERDLGIGKWDRVTPSVRQPHTHDVTLDIQRMDYERTIRFRLSGTVAGRTQEFAVDHQIQLESINSYDVNPIMEQTMIRLIRKASLYQPVYVLVQAIVRVSASFRTQTYETHSRSILQDYFGNPTRVIAGIYSQLGITQDSYEPLHLELGEAIRNMPIPPTSD